MIQRVAILGAGAVGSYFISGLQEKLGDNLWVIAEGSRKERLEREGITINQRKIALNVKTPEEAHGVDLLLVAVKYGSLEGSLHAIEQAVGDSTIVMSVMNGVDSEEIIGGKIGMERIVFSMIKIASNRKDSSVVFDPSVTEGVFFGETDGRRTERIDALAELFDGTGVRYHISEDIIRLIWLKYALNISMNLPQAIVDCNLGAYNDSDYIMDIALKLRAEVVAVAAAKDIDIGNDSSVTGSSAAKWPKARFSTLQDLDAGRHTEIDMFSGALIRMGRELGIPTPYNELTYDIIKALEEKNDGKFI
ncbi:MAG: ketopantoate reductase family protein [Coprococcus sp.]